MLNLQIRQSELKDLDQIFKIEDEAYGKYGWSLKSFTNELNNPISLYLVAENNSCNDNSKFIVGYIGAWLIAEEGHITTLVVSEKYRRKHIADILLYNLLTLLAKQGIKWLTLEVRVSNHAAINLYNKFKFKQLGIRKKYYQENNEDALLLWTENINTPEYKAHIQDVITPIIKDNSHADKYQYSANSEQVN